ncbi:MAG TPA: YihY/virulence factor BrkB family protein [Cyanobacteria bacterium UBA11372]|nr:YihY/virulence factor BrkB family protein [Cyanobacteria bacterium UBA11372]HBE52036.1 YihY/virulence factor BrkB family protein [Cyanobacteria bacterium UBA11369]
MVNLRKIWRLLKETVSEWQFNEVSLLASSLAYYTVFSLAPLLVLVIMIVGAIFGEAAAQEQIVTQLTELVGEEGAQLIATAIDNMRADATGGTFRLLFNLGFLVFGATGVFAQIQDALDRIWEVKPEPRRQIFHFLRKRLLSFAMVLVIAFLLLVSFVGNTILAAFVEVLNNITPGSGYLWQFISLLVSFGMTTLIFALIYTILPDAEIAWRDTVVGAIITALLFLVGQLLFGLFLRQTNYGSAYGVAGSFVIVITWVFYAAQILLLGAEFTKIYAKQRGAPIVPSEYAVHCDRTHQNPSPVSSAERLRRAYKNSSGRNKHYRR